MKIQNMRWGYDGGGVACGPVEGNRIVEIFFKGDDNCLYFAIVSGIAQYEQIGISNVSLFDILMNMVDWDLDIVNESQKYEDNVFEKYDFERGEEPEEMFQSKYAKVIHVGRLALQAFSEGKDEIDEAKKALEFIKPFLYRNLEEMDLPELDVDDTEWDYV